MKKNLLLLFSFIFAVGGFLIGCGSIQSVAEKQMKALRIKEKVESFNFTFNATAANPMTFSSVNLTSLYDLKVNKDTVQAYLPYFGRAYVAPMDPGEGGIKFTSTDFNHTVVEGKRQGSWKVTIKTLDANPDISLYLDVWDNGSAQLIVNDPNRQSISFQGYIVD